MGVGKVSDAGFRIRSVEGERTGRGGFLGGMVRPLPLIAPALEEIAGSLSGKVKIVKLNVDENPQTASKYGIMSIPTLMIFKNGEMASRQVGAAPEAEAGAVDHRRRCDGRINAGCERSTRPAETPAVLLRPASAEAGGCEAARGRRHAAQNAYDGMMF